MPTGHLLSVDPTTAAKRMARLVDVLLPGDDLFPAASATGTQGLVLSRLRERLGYDHLSALLEELEGLESASPADAVALVERLQAADSARFALLLLAAYTAYYASPPVVEAIRALGHDYNDAPQPLGYRLRRFDPTPGADLPLHPRGTYKRTDQIRRIDLTGVPDLDLPQRPERTE